MADDKENISPEELLPEGEQSEPSTFDVNELRNLSESLRDYKEKYLRLLAESENARKRMQKERQELTKYAVENVIVDFLNPLDHFEKALGFAANTTPEVRNWAIGFEMILNQFKEAMGNQGVKEYKSLGAQFDPHLHEAVEAIETYEHSPGTIIEECVKGYKMGEKPIRVARVKVAKMPTDPIEAPEENQTMQDYQKQSNEGEIHD